MNYLQNQRGTGRTLEPRIGDTIKAACSGTGPEGIVEWDEEIEGVVIDTDPLYIEELESPYPGLVPKPIHRVDDVVEIVRRA